MKFALHIGGGSRRGPHLIQPGIGLDILRGPRSQRRQGAEDRPAGVVPLSGHGKAEQPGAGDLSIEGIGVDAIVDVRPKSVGFSASLGHAGSKFCQLHLHAAAAQGGGLRLGDPLALDMLIGIAPGVFVFHLVAGTDINSFGHFGSPSPFMLCGALHFANKNTGTGKTSAGSGIFGSILCLVAGDVHGDRRDILQGNITGRTANAVENILSFV